MTGFFLLFQEVMHLFGRIKWHYDLLVREFGDIERFLALMECKSSMKNGTENLDGIVGEIEFCDVSFDYPSRPSEPVLRNLNLKIAPRSITAIVGDSGAGKSTISKLLMRLYDPKSGSICIDGINIKNFDLEQLHSQVAIVSQNPELYNCSLRDDIAYGACGKVSEDEIIAAAKLAKCYDFITAFRSGFDTFAGAGGSQLSGGQKQRISIARAAIRNPKILILDEATSALDAENEELVQEALENIMQGKTILIIAHRLSTIKNADEIICMKSGKVVEQGKHEELMENKGSYYSLISKQLFQKHAPKS
jgi:ABC-type multidrug transport system fused ATPase/permease subunit